MAFVDALVDAVAWFQRVAAGNRWAAVVDAPADIVDDVDSAAGVDNVLVGDIALADGTHVEDFVEHFAGNCS